MHQYTKGNDMKKVNSANGRLSGAMVPLTWIDVEKNRRMIKPNGWYQMDIGLMKQKKQQQQKTWRKLNEKNAPK